MKKVISIIVFLTSLSVSLFGQHKYWISFKDKNTTHYDYNQYLSPQAISNRTALGIALYQYSDVEVNETYVNELQDAGIQTVVKSRWLNAVSALMNEEQIAFAKNLSF